MKIFKLASAVMLALAVSTVSFAASKKEKDDSNRDANGKIVRGPYASQGAAANWFIGAGGGFNMFSNLKNNYNPGFTPALDGYFGKWFSPEFGGRIGYNGLTGSMTPPEGSASDDTDRERFGFAYVHADVLWNFSNTCGGYRSDRIWEFVPYAHFGLFRLYGHEGIVDGEHRVNAADNEFAAGVGLLNKLYVSKRVDLMWDTRMFVMSGRFHNWEVGGLCYNLCSTFGIAVNLGKVEQKRVSDATDPLAGALSEAEAALAAAKAKNDSLENALNDALANSATRDTVATSDTVTYALGIPPIAIFFEKNSSELDEAAQKQIAYYIETVFKKDPNRVLYLTGSADKSTGWDEYNINIGTERVRNTIKFIHEKFGVPMEQLKEKEVVISDYFTDVRLDRCVKIEH